MAQFNPFSKDLTLAVRSAPMPRRLDRYDPARLIGPVQQFPAVEGGTATFLADRSMLNPGRADGGNPLMVAAGHQSHVVLGVGRPTPVEVPILRRVTNSYAVDIFEQEGSRGEDKRYKAAESALFDAQIGLFVIAWNLLKAANLGASYKATLAGVSGGDGKNITDAACDVIRNIEAGRDAFRANNNNLDPTRLLMPRADLEYLARFNTTLRDALKVTNDRHMTWFGLRDLLAARLGLDIEPTDATNGGSQIITGQWTFVSVPEQTPLTPYGAPALPSAVNAENAPWMFPGAAVDQRDAGTVDFGELRSAALAIREFPSNVLEGDAPVGIQTEVNDTTELIRCNVFVGGGRVDDAATFALYNTRG